MYCERCNIEFPESLRYCKWCGQHLTHRAQPTTHIRRCQNCGHVVKSAWSYCRSCGTHLAATVPQPEVICAGCGEVVEPPGLICRVCGLEVHQEDPDADLVAALDSGPTSYSYCASCGVRLNPETNRCLSCGLPVTRRHLVSDALQTCPICKTQNRRGTGICGGCGAALSSDATTSGDLAARASGGPPTLPDAPSPAAPSPASQDAGRAASQHQAQVEQGESKSAGVAEAETTTVSYTEILGSWTPVQDASADEPRAISGPTSNGGSSGAEAGHESKIDQSVDEFKTNVIPALDLTETDAWPTESLPTGSLPGSRPTAVFDTSDSPFETLNAVEATVPQHPIPTTGEHAALEEEWGLTTQQIPEAQTQRVEPGVLTGAPPLGVGASGESGSPVVPDRHVAMEAPPPAGHSGVSETVPVLPDGALPATHSRQVPPEVAHYMAYMERQSGAAQPAAQPQQPERARKSRLVPIALVTGFVAIVILAGLAFVIWKFREKQKLSVTGIPNPAPTVSIQGSQTASPQASPTAAVKEVLAPDGMVLVPAGTYIIGRDDGVDQYHLAVPKHTVALSAFYIDKTEVTNGEYKRFVDATGHVSPDAWRGADYPEGKGNYPVIGVRWQDAVDYSEWAGKRLPSEAEWEAAARGPDGRLFPWGDRWQSGLANVGTTGIVQVGTFPAGASPNGVLDMIGNVWEWTADELKLYTGNTAKLPESLEKGIVYRVIRGGAYDSKQDASYRGFVDGSKAYPKTGFRCVKSAE